MFAPRVFGICMRYSKNKFQADDFAQEAWIIIFSKLKTFKNEGSFKGWISKITVNTCLQKLRKTKLNIDSTIVERIENGLELTPEHLKVNPKVLDEFNAEELVQFIHQLPEGFRIVFNLVAVEGYSHKEVAEMLGISVSTSRSQLARARTKLQSFVSKIYALCL